MKNKLAMLTAIIITAASTLHAQEAPKTASETQTVFKNNSLKNKIKSVGIYVVPEIQYTGLAGNFAPTAGLSGMMQANKKWGIGAGYYSTITDYTPKQLSANKAFNFDAQYGGLKFEYTPKPDAVVHVSFPLLIGAGMANIDSVNESKHNEKYDNMNTNDNYGEKMDHHNDHNENMFFVIQPGINLETNLFKYGKVFLGANYRLGMGKTTTSTFPSVYPSVTASQLSGLSVNLGVKIGIFDWDLKGKKSRQK